MSFLSFLLFIFLFEALFPHSGALGWAVRFAPQLFLPVYLHSNVGPPTPVVTASTAPPAAALHNPVLLPPTCHESFSAQLPRFTPPTSLNECVFFNSLVVRLPYSSIFCQFWLFFVFKLLSFFWLFEEAQCVYLHLHLGRKSLRSVFIDYTITVFPIFPLCPPPPSTLYLPQPIPMPLFTSMGHVYKFFGYSISYAVLYPCGYSVTTFLYFLIPSPLHPFPHSPPISLSLPLAF